MEDPFNIFRSKQEDTRITSNYRQTTSKSSIDGVDDDNGREKDLLTVEYRNTEVINQSRSSLPVGILVIINVACFVALIL